MKIYCVVDTQGTGHLAKAISKQQAMGMVYGSVDCWKD